MYFDAQIVPGLVSESPSVWLFCLLTCPPQCLAFSCFLAQQDVPGSSCTFSTLALKSAISLRSLGPFRWQMVFINQDLGMKYTHCYKVVKLYQWREVENV